MVEALGSGGAERQLSGLSSMLKAEGHDVRVITYFPKFFYKDVLDNSGVEFEYLPAAQSKYKRIPLLAKTIKSYAPEVVIAYSPSAAGIACLFKKCGFRYKLIVSERNTTQTISKREKVKFFLYRWADFIVSNSNMQAHFIEKNYPHLLSKTIVITNYVDTDYFCPCELRIVSDNVCKIICVGRDHPQKNIIRFIEAINILIKRGLHLRVDWYGSFESSYGELCKSRIKELELEQHFNLKGETKQIRDEYRKHDVFCLPSIYEGFPNVLCEAMSCGLPVICSDVCDNVLIVKDTVNGLLFNPHSIEDITMKIEHFMKLAEIEKEKMRLANRKYAVEMFSKKTFLAKYNSLIEA